jgi:hypothetical protein
MLEPSLKPWKWPSSVVSAIGQARNRTATARSDSTTSTSPWWMSSRYCEESYASPVLSKR